MTVSFDPKLKIVGMLRVLAWLTVRPLLRQRLRLVLVLGGVSLATAVLVAINHAAQASIASFRNGVTVVSPHGYIRARTGGISPSQLAPLLKSAPSQISFLAATESRAELVGPDAALPVRVLALDAPIFTEDPPANGGLPVLLSDELSTAGAFQGAPTLKWRGANLPISVQTRRTARAFSLAPATVVVPFSAMRGTNAEVLLSYVIVSSSDDAVLRNFGIELARGSSDAFYLEYDQDRANRAQALLGAFTMNISVMVLLTVLVCLFTVFNFSVLHARSLTPDLQVLHTLGVPRVALLCSIIGSLALLGALGSVIGLTCGGPIATLIVDKFSRSTEALYGVSTQGSAIGLSATFIFFVMVGAAALCALGGLLPALVAYRTTPGVSRRSSLERSSDESRTTLVVPGAFVLGALLLAWLSGIVERPLVAHLAALALICAAVTTARPAVMLGARLARVVFLRFLPVETLLALNSARSSPRQASVGVATTTLGLTLLVSLGCMIFSFRSSLEDWLSYTIRADLFVSVSGRSDNGEALPIPPPVIEALKALGSTASFSRVKMLHTRICIRHQSVTDQLCDPRFALHAIDLATPPDRPPPFRILSGFLVPQKFSAGESALINESGARKLKISPGATVIVSGRQYPLTGVIKDFGSERPTVIVSLQNLPFDAGAPTQLSIYLNERTNGAAAQVRTALMRAAPAEVLIQDSGELRQRVLKIFDDTFAITEAMRAIIVLLCGLGFSLTLLELAWSRRTELRTIQVLGAPMRTLLGAFLLEALLLTAPGMALGLIAGSGVALILVELINPLSFGWTIDLHMRAIDFLIPLGIVAIANTIPLFAVIARARRVISKARLAAE